MDHTNLLKIAAALGVAGGLFELFEVIRSEADIRAASGNMMHNSFIFLIPLMMIAGSVAMYFGNAVAGAGTLVLGIGIQHFLIEMKPRHFLAVGIAMAGALIAMYVQKCRDAAHERALAVERERARPAATARLAEQAG